MELIYLYIENDGKNIKDCEFNFSSEFRISYDRKKYFITVDKNEKFVPNFWEKNNISNVTAIIGKNGVGKSNLIKFIMNPNSSNDVILIYKNMSKIKIYSNIQGLRENKQGHSEFLTLNRDFDQSTIPTIYYSPNIHQSTNSIYLKKNIDISIRGLINIDLQNHSINGTDSGGSMISMGKMIPTTGTLIMIMEIFLDRLIF
ncbi:hypothetical protein LZQ00_04650 [Sphingobacterium sp. SRCM116780]|uniref:hypothetical protein n=1 Tax=Sphingobacterium sp. SRCM116780 TaxID=2907623 RepID=UPI001F211444|nr:hypothetical protein [Sphingobacterium sp. SRCM116780]UIR57105.1 hypothetical protein LZQ00_04650 [Sphingobacterium sp. SRCM116780]